MGHQRNQILGYQAEETQTGSVEIEVGVMDNGCTDRHIGDPETLNREIAAWTPKRNRDKKMIDWSFTTEKADKRLSKHYV